MGGETDWLLLGKELPFSFQKASRTYSCSLTLEGQELLQPPCKQTGDNQGNTWQRAEPGEPEQAEQGLSTALPWDVLSRGSPSSIFMV